MLITTVLAAIKSKIHDGLLCSQRKASYHPEDGVGPAAGFIHFCFPKVPELFPAVQQVQDVLCTGDNVLT